jgi:hypothetical protein
MTSGAVPDSDHNDLALDFAGIRFTMDRLTRDVEEVTGRCVDGGLASRTGFHPQNAGDHIDGGLVIAVVMPSGDDVRLGPD